MGPPPEVSAAQAPANHDMGYADKHLDDKPFVGGDTAIAAEAARGQAPIYDERPRFSKARILLILTSLVAIIPLNALALFGTQSSWAYFARENFVVPAPINRVFNPPPFKLQIWVGWIWWHTSLNDNAISRRVFGLKTLMKLEDGYNERHVAAQVIAAITGAVLGVFALMAILYIMFMLCNLRRAAMRGGRLFGRNLRLMAVIACLVTWGFSIALYIIEAIGVDRYARRLLAGTTNHDHFIPFPGWRWYLAMASGLLWLLIACFATGLRRAIRNRSASKWETVPPATGAAAPMGAPMHAPMHGHGHGPADSAAVV